MRSAFAVATGAALGAAARWAVGELLATDGFPWATLVVNLVGCALIGLAAVRLVRGSARWYLVVTGVLGGFTTASTFAVDTRRLLAEGRPAVALAYVALSVGGGLVATSVTRTRGQYR